MMSANKPKPFLCPDCGKEYGREKNLIIHLKVHRSVKKYKCKICAKSYKLKADYGMHMKTHDEKGSYQCHHCKKVFLRESWLNKHSCTENGTTERKYACKYCGKVYESLTGVRSHVKVGKHESPLFMCYICKQDYGTNKALLIHMQNHPNCVFRMVGISEEKGFEYYGRPISRRRIMKEKQQSLNKRQVMTTKSLEDNNNESQQKEDSGEVVSKKSSSYEQENKVIPATMPPLLLLQNEMFTKEWMLMQDRISAQTNNKLSYENGGKNQKEPIDRDNTILKRNREMEAHDSGTLKGNEVMNKTKGLNVTLPPKKWSYFNNETSPIDELPQSDMVIDEKEENEVQITKKTDNRYGMETLDEKTPKEKPSLGHQTLQTCDKDVCNSGSNTMLTDAKQEKIQSRYTGGNTSHTIPDKSKEALDLRMRRPKTHQQIFAEALEFKMKQAKQALAQKLKADTLGHYNKPSQLQSYADRRPEFQIQNDSTSQNRMSRAHNVMLTEGKITESDEKMEHKPNAFSETTEKLEGHTHIDPYFRKPPDLHEIVPDNSQNNRNYNGISNREIFGRKSESDRVNSYFGRTIFGHGSGNLIGNVSTEDAANSDVGVEDYINHLMWL